MFNTKRKRAVVLALIAFFCGATAFVAVDWKRFGGGFLAFLRPKGEPIVAYVGGGAPSGGAVLTAGPDAHPHADAPPLLAPHGKRRHVASAGGGSGGHGSGDDLFKFGDPAAGGIPPGSFVVAQNDAPAGGAGAAPAAGNLAAPETAGGSGAGDDAGSGGGGGGVGSPAPAPTGNGGDAGGVIIKTPSPSPAPAPTPATPTPPAPTPAAPTPAPTQSGTSDPGNGGGGGGTPPPVTPPVGPPPITPMPPVSAVPEASNAAMMGLGALFLAVAATRRRKNDPA